MGQFSDVIYTAAGRGERAGGVRSGGADERDEAAEWLVGFLEAAGGPVALKEIVAVGQVAGFSRAMIYRARESLGAQIVASRGCQHPRTGWRLAGED